MNFSHFMTFIMLCLNGRIEFSGMSFGLEFEEETGNAIFLIQSFTMDKAAPTLLPHLSQSGYYYETAKLKVKRGDRTSPKFSHTLKRFAPKQN